MPLYTKIQNFLYQLPLLGKVLTAFVLFFTVFASILGHSCEKNAPSNQVTFGNPKAKLSVIQHFSFGSPEFVRFAKEEFPLFKAKFIDTSLISWTFCPHITDLATIQLISCLETIPSTQKPLFFEQILLELNPRTFGEIPQVLVRALENLLITEKKVELLQLLELGDFFKQAGEFLEQKVFSVPPVQIEVGDCVFDFLTSPAAIWHQIERQLSQ
ncbi:MAG: hypothetical protein H6620_09440 [Halobacteriovoraceae bacterium]|nr:hypothetical protein [Halobacteriovoraceae bacterium]